ncbi:unnamed protein product [Rotaria magnacalcarata]|uniref:Uncharacterized protein n=3 Tax=Rotaria magnacalcarata TaxID=392030 RepID=A0A815C436_9BILA|nr:unnamed protein product [Rotaria magnacalcarata]CAF1275474.1 unnamed protein product [Rotaria magnacalcarata]CAF1928718.1 unnamed protein product [Rotaria magnacalcarata]CAF2039654.1 unnamed protein product [Rotaria magnacalcarata]CAF2077985.1 unnamed protein product [Rotaria magnacalcarata]
MMNSRANSRPYNPHVLIGNWHEDRVMEEEVLSDFLHRRNNGQLASQKTTEVERMSQTLPLSISAGDGLLRFGHQILLINTWTHAAKFTGEKSELSSCLATGIVHTESTNGGTHEVTATGTTMGRPMLRTVFVIRRSNLSVDSEPVKYGDEIMLNDVNGELFLTCVKSTTRAGRTCDVIFTNNPGRNSVWIVMHPSIHLRMELDGSEVKIDDKVVLAHASTNKCLSINEEHSNRSSYGQEYELICELSTASIASYKSPILWKFQTQSAY